MVQQETSECQTCEQAGGKGLKEKEVISCLPSRGDSTSPQVDSVSLLDTVTEEPNGIQTSVSIEKSPELEEDSQFPSTDSLVVVRRRDTSASVRMRCVSLNSYKRSSIASASSDYYSDRSSDTSLLTLFNEYWPESDNKTSSFEENLKRFRQRCSLLTANSEIARTNVLSKISLQTASVLPGPRHSPADHDSTSNGKLC